jgi:hypothetical protein
MVFHVFFFPERTQQIPACVFLQLISNTYDDRTLRCGAGSGDAALSLLAPGFILMNIHYPLFFRSGSDEIMDSFAYHYLEFCGGNKVQRQRYNVMNQT